MPGTTGCFSIFFTYVREDEKKLHAKSQSIHSFIHSFFFNLLIHSFMLSDRFILFKVIDDPYLIPGALCTRQECTLKKDLLLIKQLTDLSPLAFSTYVKISLSELKAAQMSYCSKRTLKILKI